MIELDGFTDLETIGQGGLGDVYRATVATTGATVAVKVLRDVTDESVAWHRTRRELTALVSLGGHAHVIQLLGLLEHRPGLVMEFAPGGSVADLIRRRDVTTDEAVMIGRQTASALAAAHARGIVHRDVKPQNLLIDADGQVKLCDFGIASLARTEEFRTRTSSISLRYASPEDLEDDTEVGPPSDVYSLGATLLHLTHGAPPTLKDRLAPWHAPASGDPALAALDQVLSRCLHPDPTRRPTAVEVLDLLDALPSGCRALPVPPAHEGPDTATTALLPAPDEHTDPTVARTGRRPKQPLRPVERARRRPWRRRWIAAAAVAAVGCVGAAWMIVGGGDGPTLVDRPADLVEIDHPTIVWPVGEVGACLVQVPDSDTLIEIDCDAPHDLQRFAVGTFDGDDRFEDLTDLITRRCPSPVSGFEVAWTVPSLASWSSGDRTYQCLIGVPGRRAVGSAL